MPHPFMFFRAGGFDQVLLSSASDIAALSTLDQKLWAALSCPVKGLEFDERTMALIDSDNDSRVRVGEVLAAIAFAQTRLTNLAAIIPGHARLPLAAIAVADAEGTAILACARRVLTAAGKPTSTDIGLDDLLSAAGDLANTDLNGDGIVPPETIADPTLRQFASDVLAITGGESDRNGALGVGETNLKACIAELAAFVAWRDLAAVPGTMPVGEAATAAAFAAVQAVAAKIDDYFARCRLCAYDPRAEAALNRQEVDFLALAARDLHIEHAEIAAFPLARINAVGQLPLTGAGNPAWAARMATLRGAAVIPLLGDRSTLDEAGWSALRTALLPFGVWMAAQPQTLIATGAKVSAARARAIHSDTASQQALATVIANDRAVGPEFAAIINLEKLVRLHRDLYRLLHNFANFADFYSPDRLAIFQAGTLYLDNRSFELCVRVDDVAKHVALGGLAKCYLAYCDCTRAGATAKLTICVAVTNGDSDFLMPGRNGVFYDRKGQDWDATITRIVENPISIRQAFWSPYKKAIRFVEELVAKRAAAADEAANAKLQQAAADVVTKAAIAVQTGKKGEPVPKQKFDVGTIAALGVGIGAIGGIIGGLASGFIGLGWWMPIGLIGLILAISLPSMIIAALKLRQRNLGPILDANGWAVNGRVKINIPFGTALSGLAALPPGSSRTLTDPYADKKKPWKTYLVLFIIFALAAGVGVDRLRKKVWLWSTMPDGRMRVEQILGFDPPSIEPSATASPVVTQPAGR